MSDPTGAMQRRFERERAARKQAEQLLEQKSLELFEANQALIGARDGLESRVLERTEQLSAANQSLKQEMLEREEMNRRMVELSHQAGKAEMATGVLHNVGNVLNSVNVSAGLVESTLRTSHTAMLKKFAALLIEQKDLAAFFTTDPRGEAFPGFLEKLAVQMETEINHSLAELKALMQHLDHIKAIVAMQQSSAGISGLLEPVDLEKLFNDAELLTEAQQFANVIVQREFEALPTLLLERQKLMQILVNLIKNAKESVVEAGGKIQRVVLSISKAANERVILSVTDSGHGIAEQNMTKMFSHGFTTKKDGHGFGLHSCANAAGEMHGELSASSDGVGRGATFTLNLPFRSASNSPTKPVVETVS